MTTTTILIIALNVALFLMSILYFRNGQKAYKAATVRHGENMALLDKSIAEANAANARHKEIGELLSEVQELAEGIKSGKIQHVR